MPYSTKWTTLTRANKSIFVLTVVTLALLVLGFSTPIWISISVETDALIELFEFADKQYIGLWQLCFKHYGCVDLSLLAKQFSIFTKIINDNGNKDETLNMIINKVNKIISMSIY